MSQEIRQRIIVVLGMHRSGTSAITRGLKAIGVDLGEKLMPAVAGINEKGFWEDLDVYDLNNDLLHFLGHEWHTLEPIQRSECEQDDLVSFKLRAVELLREKLKVTPIFGLKDPRFARLLPFWRIVFNSLRVDVGYIIAIRHPLSVVDSLKKRDGFELEKSSYLWLCHVVPSMVYSEGSPRIVVDYDLLMTQPEKQLRRISEVFGLSFDASASGINEYISEFLTEGLRHTNFHITALKAEQNLPKHVEDTYILLDKLAKDQVPVSSEEVHAFFARLSQYLEEMRPAFSYMTKRDGQIAKLNEVVAERDGQIANLKQVVAERDGQIADLKQFVAERDGQIAKLNEVATERDG